MVNAYQELISFEGDNWEDYLNKICLIDIFQDLIPLFKDKSALTQAIRFIVWTYSKQSDAVVLGDDWLMNKKRIFEKTLLPKEYYSDLVLLENRIIVKVIQRWIDFQDASVWSNITAFKDLMIEMRLSANSNIKNAQQETNYDQKFRNAGYVLELEKMIKDLEQELIQKDMKLKEGISEIKQAGKNHTSVGVERYAV